MLTYYNIVVLKRYIPPCKLIILLFVLCSARLYHAQYTRLNFDRTMHLLHVDTEIKVTTRCYFMKLSRAMSL